MPESRIFAVLMFAILTFTPLDLQGLDYDGKSMEVPITGMATLVDLGSKSCVPCKMMEPILKKMDRHYEGKAAIVFVDVRYYPEQGRRFGIRGIPTQIFFDKAGNEVYRHAGFMSEAQIMEQFKKMGIE